MLYLALFPFESPLFSSAPMIAWFHLSGSQGQKKYKVFLMPPCLPLRRQLSPRLKALDVYIYHQSPLAPSCKLACIPHQPVCFCVLCGVVRQLGFLLCQGLVFVFRRGMGLSQPIITRSGRVFLRIPLGEEKFSGSESGFNLAYCTTNTSAVDFLVSDARIWATESDYFSSYPKCSDTSTSEHAVSKQTQDTHPHR